MPKRIAVIDLGSTAIKVVTADAERIFGRPFGWGEFEPPVGWQTARLCALGIGESGEIRESSARAAGGIVREYVSELRARGVGDAEIVALATGNLRDARNREEALAVVEREGGPAVRVLRAEEEARLAVLGCVRALPGCRGRRVLCVDQGGGTTEVAVANGDEQGAVTLERFESFPFGTSRLLREIAGTSLVEAYSALRDRMARAIAPRVVEETLLAIATGGAVARVRAAGARALHGRTIHRRDLDRWTRELAAGRRSERAELAVAGIPVVLAILEAFGCESVTYSAAGLRYGAMFALAAGQEVAGFRAW